MSLQIYFCGSIRGGRDDAQLYAKIIQHLKKYGTVLTEHVGRPDVMEFEAAQGLENLSKHIHERDMQWLEKTHVVIAEVTQPSLGVGYELGRAVAMNKPCYCLFRPELGKKLSCMVEGAHNGESFIVREYEESQVFDLLDDYMKRYKP